MTEMPSNVRWFERLMYLALAISVGTTVWDSYNAWPITLFFAIGVGAWWWSIVMLIWFTARRRRNWARWVLFAGFVLVTVSSAGFFVFLGLYENDWQPATDVISWSITSLEALAYYFVFTGNARAWFRKDMPLIEVSVFN